MINNSKFGIGHRRIETRYYHGRSWELPEICFAQHCDLQATNCDNEALEMLLCAGKITMPTVTGNP